MPSGSRGRPRLLLLLLLVACRRRDDPEAMLRDLRAGDAQRREQAAWDLARLATRTPDRARFALQPLAAATRDADPPVRAAALRALGAIGPEAIGEIAAAAGDTDRRVLLALSKALDEASPVPAETLPVVGRLLGHKVWQVREGAAAALVKTGAPALPALAAALRVPASREPAMNALVTMKAAPTLAEATAAAEPLELRRAAIEALVRVGAPAADILPTYVRLLGDPDDAVKSMALAGLHQLGPDAAPALDALVAMLGKQPPSSSVLGHLGAVAVPRLADLVAGAPPAVALDAARALEEAGPAGRPAVPALLARIAGRATPAPVRAACLRALARTGLPDEDLATLLPHLADADGNVANAARWVFIERRPASLPALRNAAAGKEPVASRARSVLGEIEGMK